MGKRYRWIAYLFVLFGAALVVGGAFLSLHTRSFLQGASTATGTVVRMVRADSRSDSTYHPVVTFQTRAGQTVTFRDSLGTDPPSYRAGETVEVLYAESDPNQARLKGFMSLWFGPIMLTGMGGVFFLIGGGMLVVPWLWHRRDDDLRRHGTPLQTEFQSVERNTVLEVNGRSPWRIISQWQNPRTGNVHLFHSHNLWFDPTPYIHNKQIVVYVDRANPKHHYVDVSFLPKVIEE